MLASFIALPQRGQGCSGAVATVLIPASTWSIEEHLSSAIVFVFLVYARLDNKIIGYRVFTIPHNPKNAKVC